MPHSRKKKKNIKKKEPDVWKSVGVREFREHLTKYIRFAQKGVPIYITSAQKLIARLGPPPQDQGNLWNELLKSNLLERPQIEQTRLPTRIRLSDKNIASKALKKIREENES